MAAEPKTPDRFSLSRWSKRKLEAARDAHAGEASAPAPVAPAPAERSPPAAPPAAVADAVPMAASPTLPPVDSLTAESDFAAFMQPRVDDALKRQALKKLFADPRFNVMDGLDVYVDDYSKTVPVPASVLERLAKMGFVRGLGAPADEPPAEALPPGERAPALPAADAPPPATTSASEPATANDEPAEPPPR
jgi:hypothetical protein